MLVVRSTVLIACLIAIPTLALIGVPLSSWLESTPAEGATTTATEIAPAQEHELGELEQLTGMSSTDPQLPADPGMTIPASTVPAFWGGGGDERSYWQQPGAVANSGESGIMTEAATAPSEVVAHSTPANAAGANRRKPWASRTSNPPTPSASQHPSHPSHPSHAAAVEPNLAAGRAGLQPGTAEAVSVASSPASREGAMQSLIAELKSMGAAYFRLETWGDVSEFRCEMPLPDAPRYHAFFEATDHDPLQAMQQVLEKVRHWKGQQVSPGMSSPPPTVAAPLPGAAQGIRR